MIQSKLGNIPNNVLKYIFYLGNIFMILTSLKLKKGKYKYVNWTVEYQAKCWKKKIKKPQKLP